MVDGMTEITALRCSLSEDLKEVRKWPRFPEEVLPGKGDLGLRNGWEGSRVHDGA